MSRRATVTMTAVLALVLAACSGRSTDGPTSSAPDTVAPAPIPTVIVLDASDSMNTPDAPGPRIDAAKKAVTALADGLPDKTAFGVIALGATKPAATTPIDLGCGDISTVVPVAPLDKASVTRSLEPLKAQGYTPLGAAIRTGAESLAAGAASLVVVSDGEPNCSPDPCETVATIRAARPDLTISAVGFKADVPALKCVADKGGGIYITADNTAQLIARLTAVQNANLAATRLTTTGRGDMKLGDRLEDIRARHADFPTTGETSGGRTVYIWKDCAYTVENGVLVEIAPLAPGSTVPGSGGSTIDGVSVGSSMSRAIELYGKPAADQNGAAVFAADSSNENAYKIGYSGNVSDGTVTGVILCRCLPSAPTNTTTVSVVPSTRSTCAQSTGCADSRSLVATMDGYGQLRIGMTEQEAKAASSDLTRSSVPYPSCKTIGAEALIGSYHRLSLWIKVATGTVTGIDTPPGTKSDRGVGDGSSPAEIRSAYSNDHDIREGRIGGQGSPAIEVKPKVTTDPRRFISFPISEDGTAGPPSVSRHYASEGC